MRILVVLGLAGVISACGDESETCVTSTWRCDGSVLQTCSGGEWEDVEDCSEAGALCSASEEECVLVDSDPGPM